MHRGNWEQRTDEFFKLAKNGVKLRVKCGWEKVGRTFLFIPVDRCLHTHILELTINIHVRYLNSMYS